MPGSPSVRTAKSSCFGKISTRIGPFGVKLYFAESVFSASCASGIAYSRITGASSGIELQDDVTFADLDELVEAVEQREQVVGDDVVRVDLERPVERLRAPAASSPVRIRCMPSSAWARAFVGSSVAASRARATASSKR